MAGIFADWHFPEYAFAFIGVAYYAMAWHSRHEPARSAPYVPLEPQVRKLKWLAGFSTLLGIACAVACFWWGWRLAGHLLWISGMAVYYHVTLKRVLAGIAFGQGEQDAQST